MAEVEIWRHADDLGATDGITDGILACWEAGWLDGFSILANGEAGERVRERLAQIDRPARIRAHLNLSEGPSAAPAEELPDLVDAHGRLRLGFVGVWSALKSRRRRAFVAQVRREWAAQIERVVELVGERGIDGVDGHVHVHVFPALFDVAAGLAAAYGIPGIRIPREPLHLAPDPAANLAAARQLNLLKHGVVRRYAARNRRVAHEHGLVAPDRFVGLLYSGAMHPSAVRAGIEAARRRGAGSVEVLFHPGRAKPSEAGRWKGNPSVGRYPLSADRDRERECLRALYGEVP